MRGFASGSLESRASECTFVCQSSSCKPDFIHFLACLTGALLFFCLHQGSKQRSYKIGGKTPGPELYDDGLTELERRLVNEGKTAALAGAAKQRGIFVQGKGF